jgi:hypothetical protein
MKYIVFFLTFFVFGCAPMKAPVSEKPTKNRNCVSGANFAEKCPSIDGIKLQKTFTETKVKSELITTYVKLIEFIPDSENFDEWTKLVSYRYEQFPMADNDPQKFGFDLYSQIKAKTNDARPGFGCSQKNNKTDMCVLSFYLKNDGIAEINIYIISQTDAGDGIILVQYAKRVPSGTADTEVQKIKQNMILQVDQQYDKKFVESVFSDFEKWQ